MQDPVQLADDELGCPRCKTRLMDGRSPFYFENLKVGVFDSLKCDFCGYFLLTEEGFKNSSKKMMAMGLLRPKGEDYTGLDGTEIKLSRAKWSEILSKIITIDDIKGDDPTGSENILLYELNNTPLLAPKYRFGKR